VGGSGLTSVNIMAFDYCHIAGGGTVKMVRTTINAATNTTPAGQYLPVSGFGADLRHGGHADAAWHREQQHPLEDHPERL